MPSPVVTSAGVRCWGCNAKLAEAPGPGMHIICKCGRSNRT